MSETTLEVGVKFKTSAVGITSTAKCTWAEWECALSVTASIVKSSPFWLGDMLCIGHSKFGEKYSQAINDTGFDPSYLANLKYVCSRVDLSRRREELSFSHHQEVASLDPKDQDKWLALAVTNKWTRAQLREALQKDNGEDQGDVEDSDGDDELSDIIGEIAEYLDGLSDNHERATAIRMMFSKLKAFAAKYKESKE